jgi:hypothetical protein
MSQSDDQGRPESSPYGQGAGAGPGSGPGGRPYGQPPSGQPEYGQPPSGQPEYGQPPSGQPEYGQPQYGQPQSEQPQYDPQQYGQQQYPYGGQYGQQPPYQQQYGQQYGQPYGQYGASGVPARPGGVTTAAIFGFIFGALGVLATIALVFLGAAASGAARGADEEIPGLGTVSGAVGGVLIVFGVLALAWTIVVIWGSIWALSGRSRVMLLVGGSIAVAFTLFGFLAGLSDDASSGGGIVLQLVFLLAAIAIVALLSMRPAAQFYAAHRARRRR